VGLGAVLAVVAGTVAVDAATQARRTAGLADVAGVLEPLGPALHERWRVPADGRRTPAPGGDLLVTTRDGAVGQVALLDGATGERRWTAPLPELGATGIATCQVAGDEGREQRVVCRVATEMALLGFGRRRLAPDGRTVLVVLDAGTGRRVAAHDLGARFPAVGTLGADVVLAEVGADRHARVTRLDAVAGHARWTYRSPDVLGALAAGTPPLVDVRHDVVAVSGPAAWALTPDGEVLGSWFPRRPGSPVDVDPSIELRVLPDGRFAVGEPDAGGLDGQPYGTVAAGDDRDGFAIPGPLVDPVVDDGSAAGLLLVAPPGRGRVVAVDPATGRWRWQAESRGETVVVEGRLHTRTGAAVTAVDVASGRTVWRTEVATRRIGRDLLTDGRVLLVPTSGADGAPRLTALGLDDGRERWSVPAPTGVEEYLVLDGRLVALTEREAVGLG
jgi:outer membrane protein assembly factor BamB